MTGCALLLHPQRRHRDRKETNKQTKGIPYRTPRRIHQPAHPICGGRIATTMTGGGDYPEDVHAWGGSYIYGRCVSLVPSEKAGKTKVEERTDGGGETVADFPEAR